MISPFPVISLIFEFIICIYKTKESNFQTQRELFLPDYLGQEFFFLESLDFYAKLGIQPSNLFFF